EEVVAKLGAKAQAVEAVAARRGVGRHDPHSWPPVRDPFANRIDLPGELVAKDGGRHDHAGVIAAPEDFEIRPASQRDPYAHADFAGTDGRHRNVLDPHVLLAIEDGRGHQCVAVLPQIVTTTFRELSRSDAAISIALPISTRG